MAAITCDPAEKLTIATRTSPFAVEMKSGGEGKGRKLVFRLDTDDLVMAGADHPVRFGSDPDQPDPRPHVRGTIGNGLEARIIARFTRSPRWRRHQGDPPAIWSNGAYFPLVDR